MIFINNILQHNFEKRFPGHYIIRDPFAEETYKIGYERIYVRNPIESLKRIQKEIGGELKPDYPFNKMSLFVHHKVDAVKCIDKNVFAFKGNIMIKSEEYDGKVYVPSFLSRIFEREFPGIEYIIDTSPLQFIEYDGMYPAYCNGNTIMRTKHCVVKTKILRHECVKWKIKIPQLMKNVTIPQEVLEYLNKRTECCNGCD